MTDITYIRTHEGWLYLAVVVDLFSRQVVGWSMGSRIDTSLVLDALLMAQWRRQPLQPVMVHSDQGCQFTGPRVAEVPARPQPGQQHEPTRQLP